jgi:YVTN family beta-propeller protein
MPPDFPVEIPLMILRRMANIPKHRVGGFAAVAVMPIVFVVVPVGTVKAQAAVNYPVTAVINVGTAPIAVAIDPSTHNVYVANEGSDSISVIDESGDADNGTVTATVPIGSQPYGVAVDPVSHSVYVTNGNTVSVIDESGDANTGTVTANIKVGDVPDAVAVDPSTHNVYVANEGSDSISVIDESGDANTGTVTSTIPVGGTPTGVAVDPSTHSLYVVNDGSGNLSVIDESGDANTGMVTATIPIGSDPYGVAVDPSTHNVYVTYSFGSMAVIDESGDADTGTVTSTISGFNYPYGVAVDPSTHNVYVANASSSNTVSVVDESGDADTGSITATIEGFSYPFGVAVDPSTHDVYVTDTHSDTVSVITPTATASPSCTFSVSDQLAAGSFASPAALTGLSSGDLVTTSCSGLNASHTYGIFEASPLALVSSPYSLNVLGSESDFDAGLGTLSSPDGSGSYSQSLTLGTTGAGTFTPGGDLGGSPPTIFPPDANAQCPPSQAQINAGLGTCVLVVSDISQTTAPDSTPSPADFAAVALLDFSGQPTPQVPPTVSFDPTVVAPGLSATVTDAVGASTYWWAGGWWAGGFASGSVNADPYTIPAANVLVNGVPASASSVKVAPPVYCFYGGSSASSCDAGTADTPGNGVTFPSQLSGSVAIPSNASGASATVSIYEPNVWGSVFAGNNTDASFPASDLAGSDVVTLGQSTTTTVPSVVPSSPVYGQSVVYSATVTGIGGTPTGNVSFTSGSTILCTATLSGGSGSCDASNAPGGADMVTASYSGDVSFLSSVAITSVNVSKAFSSTISSVSPNAVPVGQGVTYSAAVISESGIPTGTVAFSTGTTELCTATLSGGSGFCTASNAPQGIDAVTANYSGDANFAVSSGGTILTVNPPPGSSPPPPVPSSGYDLVGHDGGVFVFPTGQSGGFYGSLPGLGVNVSDIVGMVPTASDLGYFLVGSDGGVFAFGSAPFENSLPGIGVHVNNIVGIVPTSNDQGYFVVGSDGGVFTFGNAPFLGSLPSIGVTINSVIGIAATPSDDGYWLVTASGTVYSFGNATNFGSAAGSSSPVSAIQSTPDGGGYWIVTQNGAVKTFGDAGNFGSLPGIGVTPAHPVIGLVPTADDGGYWLIGSDGGIFAFGDAPFVGSLPQVGVSVTDIVGAVPTKP